MKINEADFKTLYMNCVGDILVARPINEEIKKVLSKNEYTYLGYDFKTYLEKSWKRCWNIYQDLPEPNENLKLLDVGGFFGNFSLCLKRLGYNIALAEAYHYYGSYFENLSKYLEGQGVPIINSDFAENLEEPQEKYDIVLCLAVLEHIAHSPKIIMENLKKFLKKDGGLVLEVPNIAYWPKRYKLLKGETVLSPIDIIYKSEVPFMGHHHEYTLKEMEDLALLSGLSINKVKFFNYSINESFRNAVLNAPIFLFDSCKEVILIFLRFK